MPTMQFREVLRAAMTEEMERDDNVFLMGEEVAEYHGARRFRRGCWRSLGRSGLSIRRSARRGLRIGCRAAMVGLRPIIEFMSWSFTLVCLDQIVNNAANVRICRGAIESADHVSGWEWMRISLGRRIAIGWNRFMPAFRD